MGVRRPTTRPRWHCSPPARSQNDMGASWCRCGGGGLFHSIHRFVIVSLCSNFAAGSGETTGICARGRIVYAELDRYDRPLRPASETPSRRRRSSPMHTVIMADRNRTIDLFSTLPAALRWRPMPWHRTTGT
jgi:hypothetical protein